MPSITVQPITIGYPWKFSLQFLLPGGGAVFLQSPAPSRVRGEFRSGPSSSNALLGFVDNGAGDGSLVINGDGSITMALAEGVTANFPPGTVFLDFARLDSGVTSPVGVMFQWPVVQPVTATLS